VSHPRQPGGGATQSPAQDSWASRWFWAPEDATASHDFLTAGTDYTDDSGVAWGLDSDGGAANITGHASAGVLGVDHEVPALRVTTSSNSSNIKFRETLQTLWADYAYDERCLLVVKMVDPTLPSTNDRFAMLRGNDADSYRLRIANENTSGANVRTQRRHNSSNSESNRLNDTAPVLAIEFWGDSCVTYHASTWPTATELTDNLTENNRFAWNRAPSTAEFLDDTTDVFEWLVRRNGGSDFTIDILRMELFSRSASLA